MVPEAPSPKIGPAFGLAGVLLLAALIRLPGIAAPLADNLQIKQVYVSNKARSIARPPLNPFRNTLDFLDERGERLTLTEEVPVYTGLLGLAYRLFGERDWVGRALSLLGTLAAIAAYADLTRREYGRGIGLIGAFLLAVAPLLVFYGRAVMPDPWMLAAMLTAAACYRRYLDGLGRDYLIGAACAAALAPLCKYYGVMILIPLAEMTLQGEGSRGRRASRLFAMCAATLLPVGLWILAVFLRTANPVTSGWSGDGKAMPYLVFQAPHVLLSPTFYNALLVRFPIQDCGPMTTALVMLGVVAVVRRRWVASTGRPSLRPLMGWSLMGLTFYVVFAPKLLDHDYYELMLLPAAATWGAIGLSRLVERMGSNTSRRVALLLGVLALTAVVQSPWCMSGMFRIDRGKLILAERLKAWTDEGRRVVVIGPGIELATVIHYCDREGWALVRMQRLPDQWSAQIESFRAAGAQTLAVYFDPKAPTIARRSLEGLAHNLPVLERGTGPWSRTEETCSYWILDLQ